MRDVETGIEVFIDPQPYGPSYTEYSRHPDSVTTRNPPSERHIEAVTDQEYVICIQIPQHRGSEPAAWATCITIHVDDMFVAQKLLPAGQAYGKFEFARAGALGHDFSPSFAFGELFHDPSIQHTEEQDFSEVSRRGKIVVSVQRGRSVACAIPKWQISTSIASLATTKGVMHDRSHGLRPDKRARKRSQSVFYKSHKKLTDDPSGIGKETGFTFLYVSKEILQRRNMVANAPTQRQVAVARTITPHQRARDLQAPDGRPVFPIFLPS